MPTFTSTAVSFFFSLSLSVMRGFPFFSFSPPTAYKPALFHKYPFPTLAQRLSLFHLRLSHSLSLSHLTCSSQSSHSPPRSPPSVSLSLSHPSLTGCSRVSLLLPFVSSRAVSLREIFFVRLYRFTTVHRTRLSFVSPSISLRLVTLLFSYA